MYKKVLILLVSVSSAYAAGPLTEFSGEYHIGKAPIHDPPSELSPSTHIYLSIKGKPAQEFYDLIASEPKFSKCGIDHYEKSSGNVLCSYFPTTKEYSCDFSINISSGNLESGGWC